MSTAFITEDQKSTPNGSYSKKHAEQLPDAVVICEKHNLSVCVAPRMPLGMQQSHTGIQEQSFTNAYRPANMWMW